MASPGKGGGTKGAVKRITGTGKGTATTAKRAIKRITPSTRASVARVTGKK